MNYLEKNSESEHGGAGVKLLLVGLVLVLVAHAGYNYIPIAYEGASMREEMDSAVVKGLAASGQLKPLDVVTASVRRAAATHNLPTDTFIEIKPAGASVQAHVVYNKQVSMLPFGLYKYNYEFDYVAKPVGYLLKE